MEVRAWRVMAIFFGIIALVLSLMMALGGPPDRGLEEWQAEFVVLTDWKVRFEPSPTECMTIVNRTYPEATIYGCDPMPGDYDLHEMLHVAVRAAQRGGKEAEEALVVDLAGLITEGR
jgi:hypothetical protein